MRRLWKEYRATLKSPEVEETIDLFVHRPLAFILAKLAFRTPLTPNMITLLSMVVGVAGGLALFGAPPWGGLVGAGLLFTSQVLDCADGMLARMRKSSSELGRILDGMADGTTLTAACLGTTWGIARLHPNPPWLLVPIIAGVLLTIHLGSLQTVAYDHYKNVFLRMTREDYSDEDLEVAEERARTTRGENESLLERFSWFMYFGFLRRQRRLLGWFDPHTVVRLAKLPDFDPERARIYRQHALPPLRWLRGLFGVGSLVFGFVVFSAIGRPDWFLVYRLIVLNLIFFVLVWPLQRRASRRAFQALGLEHLTLGRMRSDTTMEWSTDARPSPDPKATDTKAANVR